MEDLEEEDPREDLSLVSNIKSSPEEPFVVKNTSLPDQEVPDMSRYLLSLQSKFVT